MLPTVMNNPISSSTDPTAPPPPPPPQPPRSSFSCDRHPAEQFTGFCPSCLCERLTTLDNNNNNNSPSSSRRPSSASAAAAAAIKSLFSAASKPPPPPPKPSKPSFCPELRRTKSFSASKNEALSQFFEPQRKSCDVRVRNTLWSLFSLDDGGAAASSGKKIGSFSPNKPVFEETEVDDDDFRDPQNAEMDENHEIQSVRESQFENSRNAVEFEVNNAEIVEEEEEEEEEEEGSNLKIKQHIDLNTQEKKSSGGFWAAASVFSKKWHKWRRKQKLKKQNNATLPVEKPISRQFRETQSEIADYGFGRRSCDTDPRFSLDAGRVSFDDARYSFDEPRASWDGYLIGRSFPRMAPMVSVLEDSPAARVSRSRPDMEIPVEEPASEGVVPGGTMQTKEYYSDSSSSRRRKSLDRSGSIRKTAASVVAEMDELKMASNAKVSPTTADCFHGAKVVGERELGESNSQHSLSVESCEMGSGYRDRDCTNSLIGGGERKEAKKPSRRWSWRIWGFIHRRSGGGSKDGDEEEKYSRVNGVGRSMSVSWQDLRGVENGDVGGRLNINMFRSNSSVSMRNGGSIGGSMRKLGIGRKRRDEIVLERNRSARYSPPSHVDNGLLRFYLTPLRRRGGGGLGKIKANGSSSVARSVLRLY